MYKQEYSGSSVFAKRMIASLRKKRSPENGQDFRICNSRNCTILSCSLGSEIIAYHHLWFACLSKSSCVLRICCCVHVSVCKMCLFWFARQSTIVYQCINDICAQVALADTNSFQLWQASQFVANYHQFWTTTHNETLDLSAKYELFENYNRLWQFSFSRQLPFWFFNNFTFRKLISNCESKDISFTNDERKLLIFQWLDC